MKDRILQIMKQEKMTQQDFASALGISPASLSSIFNGRTNPTNNHVQAIHRCFPTISVNWLMFGEGDMYGETGSVDEKKDTEVNSDGRLNFADESSDGSILLKSASVLGNAEGGTGHSESSKVVTNVSGASSLVQPVIHEVIKYVDKPQRKITEIRIFFDDGTYETFSSK
ncbi:MAG: helix-turn-helix transcriptional regulator [Paraprevotella sp.]|nr:helix-turn-helix transcriptional regulator [Paraprevotella sp.]MBP3470860.1 helix-turn-helix transcriptional regulator [Paraprevotella sp.]